METPEARAREGIHEEPVMDQLELPKERIRDILIDVMDTVTKIWEDVHIQ